jgi:hypothetical protein
VNDKVKGEWLRVIQNKTAQNGICCYFPSLCSTFYNDDCHWGIVYLLIIQRIVPKKGGANMDIGSILVYMSTGLFFVVFGMFGFFLYMLKRKEKTVEQEEIENNEN